MPHADDLPQEDQKENEMTNAAQYGEDHLGEELARTSVPEELPGANAAQPTTTCDSCGERPALEGIESDYALCQECYDAGLLPTGLDALPPMQGYTAPPPEVERMLGTPFDELRKEED